MSVSLASMLRSTASKITRKFEATLAETVAGADRPWMKFRGCFSKEDGEELAALIEEMFPTEKNDRATRG